MNCTHCNDTGSLSKELDGYLDCVHCDVAEQRAALDTWASTACQHAPSASAERWMIYRHGQAAAAPP